MKTFTIKEHEIKRNILFYDTKKYAPNSKLTDEEVMEILRDSPNDFHTVNHEDRIQFLKDNGYEVTRENMVADLSAKPPEEG